MLNYIFSRFLMPEFAADPDGLQRKNLRIITLCGMKQSGFRREEECR